MARLTPATAMGVLHLVPPPPPAGTTPMPAVNTAASGTQQRLPHESTVVVDPARALAGLVGPIDHQHHPSLLDRPSEKDVSRALLTAERVIRALLTTDAGNIDRTKEAAHMILMAYQMAKSSHHVNFTIECRIAEVLAQMDKLYTATDWLRQIETTAATSPRQNSIYERLCQTYHRLGNFKEMLRVASLVVDDYDRFLLHLNLAHLYIAQGKPREAEDVLCGIEKTVTQSPRRDDIYKKLCLTYQKLGSYDEMMRIASLVPDEYERYVLHRHLAVIYINQDKREEAERVILDYAKSTTPEGIEDALSRSKRLLPFISTLILLNLTEKIDTLTRDLDLSDIDFRGLFNRILISFVKQGHADAVIQAILSKYLDKEDRSKMEHWPFAFQKHPSVTQAIIDFDERLEAAADAIVDSWNSGLPEQPHVSEQSNIDDSGGISRQLATAVSEITPTYDDKVAEAILNGEEQPFPLRRTLKPI